MFASHGRDSIHSHIMLEDDKDLIADNPSALLRFSTLDKLGCEFVFTACLAIISTMHQGDALHEDLQPFAVGAAVTFLVFLGGPISGAHFNPSVTVAIGIFHKKGAIEMGSYVGAQICGACLGSFISASLGGYAAGLPINSIEDSASGFRLGAGEFLGTLLFCAGVIGVMIDGSHGRLTSPVIIGLLVLLLVLSFRDVSGALFNPAITLALFVPRSIRGQQHSDSNKSALVYLIAQFSAAAVAGGISWAKCGKFRPAQQRPLS